MKARLNFLNFSYDINNTRVVLFQKNRPFRTEEPAIAWKVIRNCWYEHWHPFIFSDQAYLVISDRYGNSTPPAAAEEGQLFRIPPSARGPQVERFLSKGKGFRVENRQGKGAVTCKVLRSGRLLSLRHDLAPGQEARFDFGTSIFVGAGSHIEEGQLLGADEISQWKTEFDLTGVFSADLIMTGGGWGPRATALQFHLHHVKHWPIGDKA